MSAGCLSVAVTPEAEPFAGKERSSPPPAPAGRQTLRQYASEGLAAAGSGRFQLMAAAVLGLANCSDAVELLAISFILPNIPSTREERAFMSAGSFVGMLIGGYGAGLIADSFGRKSTLCCSLLLNALFGGVSAAAPNATALAALRLVAGIGVGGSVPTIFTLLVELLAPQNRGFFVNVVAFCWVLGMVFTAGTAWLVLGVAVTTWRWFAVVCAFPALIGAICVWQLLPESPLWLARQGRAMECAAALKLIAKWNGRTVELLSAGFPSDDSSDPGPLTPDAAGFSGTNDSLDSDSKLTEQPATAVTGTVSIVARATARGGTLSSSRLGSTGTRAATGGGSPQSRTSLYCVAPFMHMAKTLRLLYCGRGGVWQSAVLLSIVWFTLSLAWYSMALWQPTIFKQAGLSLNVYQDAFISAAANVPGNLLAMLVLDRVGRKATLVASMLGSAVCAVGFAFARTETTVLVASCLLSAISVGSWNALDAMSVEYFPSALRSSAMGTLAATGRLGSIIGQVGFGLFVTDSVTALLVVTAALLGVGAVAGILLPFDTAGKVLDDAGDDEGGAEEGRDDTPGKEKVPVGQGVESEHAGLLGA